MYPGKSLIAFLLGLFLLHSPPVPQRQVYAYKKLFDYAERLSNDPNPSDEKDALALQTYLKVISILTTSTVDNPFLFKTYVSAGAFLQVLSKQQQAANYFKKAILLKGSIPGMKDSALFKPLVYCGNAYYQLDHLDTAETFYKQAENIAEKFPTVSELERLYNTLGVISYSGGNYTKSITYYEKAISTLQSHPSFNNVYLVDYKNNLASAYKKLKRYDLALEIYQGLLSYRIETDKLLHNIGSVYLATGNGAQAIKFLKQVKYEDQKKLNDLGRAYFEEKDYNNAISYLQKAADFNIKNNHGHKNSDYGLTLKYFGDTWFEQGKIELALAYYQQAMGNLTFDFRSTDIYTNPDNFNSVFNGVELMETLLAKSVAFKALYTKSGKINDLEASLQSYLAFYKLANYIEIVYETDESRLLISNRKYASHQEPIDICLQLFKITSDKKYIEQAFLLDEENKANTLSLYLEESKLKAKSDIPLRLLKDETDLKENITRISLKASGETDSAALSKLKNRLNEYSINLMRIEEKINKETGFGRLKFSGNKISVASVQKIIPPGNTILSYHIGDTSILCFIITDKKFEFFSSPTPTLFPALKEVYRQAQVREGNNVKEIRSLGQLFYKLLLKPAEASLSGTKSLMIIPDDELNYLPFEILVNEQGKSLLSQFAITYNYSCTVLKNSSLEKQSANMKNLGMAPFDEKIKDPATSINSFVQLPASRAEILTLHGTNLFNKDATKKKFINDAHHYNIIHLATHAYANDKDPNQSFIAFYPAQADSAIGFKLYLPEIYNLKLDKTRLVVLSACESGVGELVKGEGLMSLSRAFSYAGCNNIITSMWKADDASTAYISGRLHFYLQKGYDISQSLQQAKLDYLNDNHIAATQKLPGYWAHMRLIGNFEVNTDSHISNIYITVSVLLIVGIIAFIKRSRIIKMIRLRF